LQFINYIIIITSTHGFFVGLACLPAVTRLAK